MGNFLMRLKINQSKRCVSSFARDYFSIGLSARLLTPRNYFDANHGPDTDAQEEGREMHQANKGFVPKIRLQVSFSQLRIYTAI
jgi:hypothetical protein